MEPPLRAVQLEYKEAVTGNTVEMQVLCVAATEAQTAGFAYYVVNNNELILPLYDDQNKLTGWDKGAFEEIYPEQNPHVKWFQFNTNESDLESLIGEIVFG